MSSIFQASVASQRTVSRNASSGITPRSGRRFPDRFIRSMRADHRADLEQRLLLDVQRAPVRRAERIAQRAFDVAVATLALVLFSPIMLLAAIALKLEASGLVIVRERRKDFDGREFFIYRFRTVAVPEDGPYNQRRTDCHTNVGRVLRQTSIDELPQLINVLMGTMTLVGARPYKVWHDYGA